jgi:hypothetical protein
MREFCTSGSVGAPAEQSPGRHPTSPNFEKGKFLPNGFLSKKAVQTSGTA